MTDGMDSGDSYLLRPAEVVELLGVSRSWLYQAAKAGRIPCVRLGGPDGPVRFKAHDLEAWIEGGRVGKEARAISTSTRGSVPLPQPTTPPDVGQTRLLSDGAV